MADFSKKADVYKYVATSLLEGIETIARQYNGGVGISEAHAAFSSHDPQKPDGATDLEDLRDLLRTTQSLYLDSRRIAPKYQDYADKVLAFMIDRFEIKTTHTYAAAVVIKKTPTATGCALDAQGLMAWINKQPEVA